MKEFDYLKMAQTAINLIARFGKTVQLRTVSNTGSDFNPILVPHDEPIKAVIIDYKNNEIDGTLIKAQDKKMLTASAVKLSDNIVDDSTAYSVVSVNKIAPGATVLVYKVQLRI